MGHTSGDTLSDVLLTDVRSLYSGSRSIDSEKPATSTIDAVGGGDGAAWTDGRGFAVAKCMLQRSSMFEKRLCDHVPNTLSATPGFLLRKRYDQEQSQGNIIVQ